MTNIEINRVIEGISARLEPFAESFVKQHVEIFMRSLVGDAEELRARAQAEIREAVRCAVADSVNISVDLRVKDAVASPMFCEHANEVPRTCPCEPACFCRVKGSCRRL